MQRPLSLLPEPAAPPRAAPRRRRSMHATATLFAFGALIIFVPLWVPLVLAAWVAHLARGPYLALSKRLGDRTWAAGLITLGLLLAVLTPFVVVALSLASEANELVQRLTGAAGLPEFLKGVVTRESGGGGGPGAVDPRRMLDLAREHGQRGLTTLQSLGATLTTVIINLFVFLFGAFALLTEGPRYYRWAVDHAPLARPHAHRFVNAFEETGRGLLIGVGLTALVQGAIATATYALLGVPQALLLGLITCFTALIPSFGTSVVWVPIAAGLALSGRTGAALAMVAVGVTAIGLSDNVLRPVLARYGKLDLPVFVLVVAMFGGLALAGPWGLILGPLLVRLGKEAIVIAREEGIWGTAPGPDGDEVGTAPASRPRPRDPAAKPLGA
ncbi:MAG TPA: AI-2E family transporter [Polyangiaceae bacterium]|nr:AI-2E family transporter [Polyangiaceae bacterium]